MNYIDFDESRKYDLILLGRVSIDFNPAYSDEVKEDFKPLKKVHYFEKFVGGSPANIAVGITHHGMKAGFIGKVSDDQFGDFVVDYFNEQGIDTSNISRCTNGEKLGLTFTEMKSPIESSILMYRNRVADLQLSVDDIKEEYIKQAKAILISGTALAESPSREAALKAVMLARRVGTKIIFDIDYRNRLPSRLLCWPEESAQRSSSISTTETTTGRTLMRSPSTAPWLPRSPLLSSAPGKSST